MWIEFILNKEWIRADIEPGLPLLDFIRIEKNLPGTKTGCREGDCGACAVLEGNLVEGDMHYRTIVSCLTPMINVQGKHIVTVEGLNLESLSPVQQAMVDNSATQCGFCTPGFVVSMTAFMMNEETNPLLSIGGNICRCTGYKSIERAAKEISELKKINGGKISITQLVEKKWIPDYFNDIAALIANIDRASLNQDMTNAIAGGTDLMVQKASTMLEEGVYSLADQLEDEIRQTEGRLEIGAGIRITDFFQHELIRKYFSFLQKVLPWFASDPIRNMGTLTGNLVNASPIGDLTIVLLSLGASLKIISDEGSRVVKLEDFYRGYKLVDLNKKELISHIFLSVPSRQHRFHFIKVSKRSYLDIASVNSAMTIKRDGRIIEDVRVAVGGVAATPLLLKKSAERIKKKSISVTLIAEFLTGVQEEIAPISDIRGTDRYKRLLLRQQLIGHFIHLFPEELDEKKCYHIIELNPIPHEEY